MIFLVWTALCGAIFLGAKQLETPVPSAGPGHREAEAVALAVLIGRDSRTYGDYIVMNSAQSSIGSVDGRSRWVVLCNVPEGGTRDTAIVVELEAWTMELIGFRRPGERALELNLP